MRLILAAASLAATASPAFATITYDTNVTPTGQLLFGNGNANVAFTRVTEGAFEIGLRGKLRYDNSKAPGTGSPAGVYNSDGGGGYHFTTADGIAPANRSVFNFDWSVNVDVDGTEGNTLNQFSYQMLIDYDPGPGVGTVDDVDRQFFDPIAPDLDGSWDHGLGDWDSPSPPPSSDPNPKPYVVIGEGGDLNMTYSAALSTFSVAQNSWNLGFFLPSGGFDPQTLGTYTVSLAIFDGTTEMASASIDITYSEPSTPVPVPAALPLMAAGLAALGLAARRRRG